MKPPLPARRLRGALWLACLLGSAWLGHIGNSGSRDNSTYESHIAEFVPGYEAFRLPPDAGIFLARSNRITFNRHYNPYGVETSDQPVLALWYHKDKPPQSRPHGTSRLAGPILDGNVRGIPGLHSVAAARFAGCPGTATVQGKQTIIFEGNGTADAVGEAPNGEGRSAVRL